MPVKSACDRAATPHLVRCSMRVVAGASDMRMQTLRKTGLRKEGKAPEAGSFFWCFFCLGQARFCGAVLAGYAAIDDV